MALGTVRMIRATLLYDTLALRLDHSIDLTAEYVKYRKGVGREAQKRTKKKMRRLMERGFGRMDYLRFEETMELGTRLLYRTQRLFDTLSFKSLSMHSKPIVVLFEAFRFILNSLILFGIPVVIIASIHYLMYGYQINFSDTLSSIVLSVWFQLFILILICVYIRRIYLRLKDRD